LLRRDNGVAHVQLDRASKANAMDESMWREFTSLFDELSSDAQTRCVVLSGAGKHFSAGIDLALLMELAVSGQDSARNAVKLRSLIARFQSSFTAVAKCRKPVVAAVHGKCYGAGVDLISSCDVRLASSDAEFSIKEVQIGLAADVGTLQRLPKVCGNDSLVRELALTGRDFGVDEALRLGMISRVVDGDGGGDSVLAEAFAVADAIALNSPVAVEATKRVMDYSREHSVDDGLDYVAAVNASMLQSRDLARSLFAAAQKEQAVYPNIDQHDIE
jgi:enoyl-CoA hydratase/carnithine racemase